MFGRSCDEYGAPRVLEVGDRVAVSIKGKYHRFIVREVIERDDDDQDVVASYPGKGAVRFVWDHTNCIGKGHRRTFHFVRHGDE